MKQVKLKFKNWKKRENAPGGRRSSQGHPSETIRRSLLFLLHHVTCGSSGFPFPRTRCGLQWRNEHGVHFPRGRRELRHQRQEVVEQRWVLLFPKKKKKKQSLFFTLELIRFCEIQDSVNKQLHCCQDQLALNYYWGEKNTGNIKTTQGWGSFYLFFFIANEVALTESTECCCWELLSKLRLISSLNTAKDFAQRSCGSGAETTLEFYEQ